MCQVRFSLGDDRDKGDDSCILMMLGILRTILETFVKKFIRFGSKANKLNIPLTARVLFPISYVPP